jgi:hypothetical protein
MTMEHSLPVLLLLEPCVRKKRHLYEKEECDYFYFSSSTTATAILIHVYSTAGMREW